MWTGQVETRQSVLLSVQVYCAMFLMCSVVGWMCEEVFCRAIDGYWKTGAFSMGPICRFTASAR